jgi:hypothetical protein
MTSPLVGIVFIGIAVYGMILLWQGATGRDTDLFGASAGTKGLFTLGGNRDEAAIDRAHPPETHPTRLMVIGAVLIVVGFGLGALWTVLAF